MRIENVPEKAQKKAPTGTWMEHWETNAKKKASKCTVLGCETPAEVGAQVFKPSMGMTAVYIVPLCAVHAGKVKEAMDVAESTIFVLAKK
jgi:hypothetical protein